ncbi:MAG: hypothetical protein M3443_18635, partial [Actinomycetota bacterium]|nr:hypothetical protein [Actinomycetota bacterium]
TKETTVDIHQSTTAGQGPAVSTADAIHQYAGRSRTLTQQRLAEEATAAFGSDPLNWACICPNCGDIATAAAFKATGADPNLIGRECIGRSLGALVGDKTLDESGIVRGDAPRGCDWAAHGLFSGPWQIQVPTGGTVPGFALAVLDGKPLVGCVADVEKAHEEALVEAQARTARPGPTFCYTVGPDELGVDCNSCGAYLCGPRFEGDSVGLDNAALDRWTDAHDCDKGRIADVGQAHDEALAVEADYAKTGDELRAAAAIELDGLGVPTFLPVSAATIEGAAVAMDDEAIRCLGRALGEAHRADIAAAGIGAVRMALFAEWTSRLEVATRQVPTRRVDGEATWTEHGVEIAAFVRHGQARIALVVAGQVVDLTAHEARNVFANGLSACTESENLVDAAAIERAAGAVV